MKNIFKTSKKKNGVETLHVRTVNPPKRLSFEDWVHEVGAAKCYTPFKPFEDPNLVEGSGDFNAQLKIELILSLQQKCSSNQNK